MEPSAKSAYSTPGKPFTRDTNYINDRIVADPQAHRDAAKYEYNTIGTLTTGLTEDAEAWPVEADRYRLVAARACPWANRTIIVRRLLGLEDAISLGTPGPTHDSDSWTFDLDPHGVDPVLGTAKLQENYVKRFPDYPRGITVPAIVDIPTGGVVTNDYPQITLDFSTEWTAFHRAGAPNLLPDGQLDEMFDVIKRMFTEINNGVYRAGFVWSQQAYEEVYDRLFTARAWLEQRLADSRFLWGQRIPEADVRLFTTLVRFDAAYHGHVKCNRNEFIEFPALWAYARDLFQTPGFGDTVDFQQIKDHYYIVHHDVNPTGIVPKGPVLAEWLTPHGREELGGSPFGDGTAPGPVREDERVDAANNPLYQ